MSAYSRIEKMVYETGRTHSLRAAAELLGRGMTVDIGANAGAATPILAAGAVALALRCLRGPVDVMIDPAIVSVPWMGSGLRELLAREAEIYGQPDRLRFDVPTGHSLRLGIGSVRERVNASASGWHAAVNTTVDASLPAVPPAAALAVAFAFAKLFGAEVLGLRTPLDEQLVFDLWDFDIARGNNTGPLDLPRLDLGRLGLLGAGAIGSAFAWALFVSGWRAGVDVIDYDAYDQPNEETSLLIGKPDVLERPQKAERLAQRMTRNGLDVTPRVVRIDAESIDLQRSYDVFLCAVDNLETRRSLDAVNANLLVNAAVGGSPEDAGVVLWTRHGSGDRSLSTTYGRTPTTGVRNPRTPEEFINDECCRVAYEGVSLAAPFVALAAASLLLGSCAHAALGATMNTNEVEFDMFRMLTKFASLIRH